MTKVEEGSSLGSVCEARSFSNENKKQKNIKKRSVCVRKNSQAQEGRDVVLSGKKAAAFLSQSTTSSPPLSDSSSHTSLHTSLSSSPNITCSVETSSNHSNNNTNFRNNNTNNVNSNNESNNKYHFNSRNDEDKNINGCMWLNNTARSVGFFPGRKTMGPLFLLIWGPTIAIGLLMVIKEYNGSCSAAVTACINDGMYSCVVDKLPSYRNTTAWLIVGVFMTTAMLLTRFLPCKMFLGPPSPTGYRNSYHNNGIQYWLAINILFLAGSKQIGFGLYSMGILHDHYNDIVLSLCIVAILFCIFLYIKGVCFPSSADCGTTGNIIFDFYYGTELHPNVLGWDVKQFTNDRFGMAWWGISCLSFAGKQFELYGYISEAMVLSVVLQWVYLTKFFVWESGYFCSLDIQHDRAGFYICWGCLVWVPSVYTSPAYWITTHPINIGITLTLLFIFIGLVMIFVNYDADRQRQKFRQSGGKTKIWGKNPCKINAVYTDQYGEVKQAILLASGWWGIARHFHYVPEIAAALCWASPVHFDSILPYLYTFYLIILLVDRAFRDDARCYSKYGPYWNEYCKLVPYKIIPHVL